MSLDNVEKPSFATNNQSLNFNNNVNNTNDLVNCDLTQFVVVDSNTLEWSESPQSGVRRRKLERMCYRHTTYICISTININTKQLYYVSYYGM